MKTAVSRMMLAVLVGTSSVALAGTVEETAKRTVHFADLNLNQAPAAAVLYGRIHSAARDVCAPLTPRDLRSQAVVHSCVEQAIARAVDEVNAPMLTSYYLQMTQPRTLIARR